MNIPHIKITDIPSDESVIEVCARSKTLLRASRELGYCISGLQRRLIKMGLRDEKMKEGGPLGMPSIVKPIGEVRGIEGYPMRIARCLVLEEVEEHRKGMKCEKYAECLMEAIDWPGFSCKHCRGVEVEREDRTRTISVETWREYFRSEK